MTPGCYKVVPLSRTLCLRGVADGVRGLGGDHLTNRNPGRGRKDVYILVRGAAVSATKTKIIADKLRAGGSALLLCSGPGAVAGGTRPPTNRWLRRSESAPRGPSQPSPQLIRTLWHGYAKRWRPPGSDSTWRTHRLPSRPPGRWAESQTPRPIAYSAWSTQHFLIDNMTSHCSPKLWSPFSADLNPLDFSIQSVLETRAQATSHNNLSSLCSSIFWQYNGLHGYVGNTLCSYRRRRKQVVAALAAVILNKTSANII
jgi:hypothetical protein